MQLQNFIYGSDTHGLFKTQSKYQNKQKPPNPDYQQPCMEQCLPWESNLLTQMVTGASKGAAVPFPGRAPQNHSVNPCMLPWDPPRPGDLKPQESIQLCPMCAEPVLCHQSCAPIPVPRGFSQSHHRLSSIPPPVPVMELGAPAPHQDQPCSQATPQLALHNSCSLLFDSVEFCI